MKCLKNNSFIFRLYSTLNEDTYTFRTVDASTLEEAENFLRDWCEENGFVSFELIEDPDKNPFEKPVRSSKIGSSKAIDAFEGIDEDEAEDIDSLKRTFTNRSDLKAVLEDYFHIYDDLAEMDEDEFERSFRKFVD